MASLLGQLVYTSFAAVGFQTLVSPNVPQHAKQAFGEQIVPRYWDPYVPRPLGECSVYILQLAPEECLFGWLYSDGEDDLGRGSVPYFCCYYHRGAFDAGRLDTVLACLHRGPVQLPDRHRPPPVLAALPAPDLWSYAPVRPGTTVSAQQREGLQQALQQRQALHLFAGPNSSPATVSLDMGVCGRLATALADHLGPLAAVIVRQTVTRAAQLSDPQQRLQQVYRDLAAEVADSSAAAAFQAEIRRVLSLEV
ncbi:hypothetical protein [Gloeobacter kilaueensis]|uniref:WD repeat-containing protein n=1 Tax=Gloeobacter kilaueensis (strain ATCC BAA-2537 / CCAP 1431/1 / ULC 316 / JS1) TaxID=1183438 RepID=U5QCE5_GLOK1|nr:hypothetical protein [Gloeobacter kilaueensis]AGY56587.1 WD repeat-containing protein [Gloeobacter kilaueensis JS1]